MSLTITDLFCGAGGSSLGAQAAGMTGYIPTDLTKKDRVKLAGNAVTPPVMEFICSRLVEAIGAAA